MTRRFHRTTFILATVALLVAISSVVGIAAAKTSSSSDAEAATQPIRLAQATLIVEVNATDGDAGLQVFLDGEPWRSMTISGPDGQSVLEVEGEGRLHNFGLTELFSESSEPPFDVFPLEKFKELFPEGRYTFSGTTVKGQRIVGEARLSHDIPDGPEITAPADGATVARDSVVARWSAVPEPRGIDIVGYRVIVTRESPLRVFNADLPASARRMPIPSEFLQSGIEYKLEVQAIEAGGNQTLEEITFSTR
jgi:hypothetical protein